MSDLFSALTQDEWRALTLSLKVSVVATLASLPLGLWVAWLLARREFPGRSLLDGLVHLPLVLPPVVTGYLLLLAFGRRGTFGAALAEIGIVFSFRWTGAALACAVMGFPLMVRAMRLSIEAVDQGLEQAAATLGASPLAVFATVTLPLSLPGILAGAVLAFSAAGFVLLYGLLFRAELRVWRYWLLVLPVALLTSWGLNVVRLAALVAIGARVSPELAIGGFHSYAGWMFFTLLALGFLAGVRAVPVLHGAGAPPSRRARTMPGAEARILPFVAFMLASVLVPAFSPVPDLAYPVKVVAMAGARPWIECMP